MGKKFLMNGENFDFKLDTAADVMSITEKWYIPE